MNYGCCAIRTNARVIFMVFCFGTMMTVYQLFYTQKIGPNLAVGPPNLDYVIKRNTLVRPGGHFIPSPNNFTSKAAIIIPFRQRDDHLRYFLHYMHPILQHRGMEYKIYILNQFGDDPFNRAKLMNVGFVEARKDGFQCFIFHDVDLVLTDSDCPITCSSNPVHLGYLIDKFGYRPLRISSYMGGAAALTTEQFEKINGMSNSFWAWGGEDDDLYWRVVGANMTIVRHQNCKYNMVKHGYDHGNKPNPKRWGLLTRPKVYGKSDGLNSLNYKIISTDIEQLYTNVTVDLLASRRNKVWRPNQT